MKVPPLDHFLAFITACRSTLKKSSNEVAIARTSLDPSGNSGFTELLSGIVDFDWN